MVLACDIASYAFEKRLRGVTFRALALGAGLHLLLDALQKRVVDAYGVLFPFAWKDVWGGVFWPDENLYALPVLVAAILSVETVQRRYGKAGLTETPEREGA